MNGEVGEKLYEFGPLVVPDFDVRFWIRIMDTVNDRPLGEHAARTVRIVHLDGERPEGGDYSITGRLLVSADGFDLAVRRAEDFELVQIVPLWGVFDPSILDGVELREVETATEPIPPRS